MTWKLVPVEPTPEMLAASTNGMRTEWVEWYATYNARLWELMLAAAPVAIENSVEAGAAA